MSYEIQNFFKATITLDWSIGTGNFYVSTKPTVSTGWVVVSPNNATLREIVKYTSTGTDANGDYIVISVRGVGGTTEQTHSIGETVHMNITAEYWDAMNDDIAAIVASGVSNANTTTMGGVEIATSAEVDAGTETGGTGASLALTPKNVSDSHNIPLVVPGTDGNLMTSNGTDWVSEAPVYPIPAFQQKIPAPAQGAAASRAMGSNTDGSVIYVVHNNATELWRYERDAKTGAYFETHSVSIAVPVPGSDYGSIIQIGNYIYYFTNDATNIVCYRYLAADLTDETLMTVPTVGCTDYVIAWTDGTNAYVISNGSNTTSRKWTLSGTVFTASTTATVSNVLVINGNHSSMWDGTNAYIVRFIPGTSIIIYKLTVIDGSTITTTTKLFSQDFSDVDSGSYIVNIDTQRLYIGVDSGIYDEAALTGSVINLIPVTKP